MHAFIERDGPAREPLPHATSRRPTLLDGVRDGRRAELLGTTAAAVAVVGGASEGLGQVDLAARTGSGDRRPGGNGLPEVTYPWLAAAERR